MTPTTIPRRVKALIKRHGGLNRAARAIRLSAPYLMRLRDGDKDDPSDFVLRKLRLTRIVRYYDKPRYVNCQSPKDEK